MDFNNPLKYVDPTGYIAIKDTPEKDREIRRKNNNKRFKGDREHKQKSERDSLTPGEEVKEPEPEEEVSGWDRFLSGLNTTLDAAGLVPGFGIVPDILSAGVYAIRRLPGEAALSIAAAAPAAGQAVTVGRYIKRAAAMVTKSADKLGDFAHNYQRSVGASQRVPKVLQTGGNKLNNRVANSLNDHFGENYPKRDWGRALEGLKKDNGLRNDHHGRILDNGDYVNDAGDLLGNIGDYLP